MHDVKQQDLRGGRFVEGDNKARLIDANPSFPEEKTDEETRL
jgi:hypothetical protein